MNLLPIDIDENRNSRFYQDPDCVMVLQVFEEHYKKVGFNKPWIAYFVADHDNNILGAGGFKGMPKEGKVEISYGTFQKYQGKGFGTEICRQLVILSLKTDPSVSITARTLPENKMSIAVLKRNGFECLGKVFDEEDGEVLEWQFVKNVFNPQ